MVLLLKKYDFTFEGSMILRVPSNFWGHSNIDTFRGSFFLCWKMRPKLIGYEGTKVWSMILLFFGSNKPYYKFQISVFFSSYERFVGHTKRDLLPSKGDLLPSKGFVLHSKFASKLSTTNWKLYDKNKINRVHKIE